MDYDTIIRRFSVELTSSGWTVFNRKTATRHASFDTPEEARRAIAAFVTWVTT